MTPGVTLRAATVEDVAAGARLHRACWQEAYGDITDDVLLTAHLATAAHWEARWLHAVESGPPRIVAEHSGELVGFACAGPAREDDAPTDVELQALYVLRAWYGSGLGQVLLDEVVGDRSCHLWVLEDNARARAFYARNGFLPDGARKKYLPLDAWEVRLVR